MSQEIAKKILIAEDEEAIRGVMYDALVAEGFSVSVAGDGHEALVKISETKPDLILLDVLMPRMDGTAVLKELQANDETKSIPVILLTNLDELETVSKAVDAEATDYIVKADWSIQDIVTKIKNKLNK